MNPLYLHYNLKFLFDVSLSPRSPRMSPPPQNPYWQASLLFLCSSHRTCLKLNMFNIDHRHRDDLRIDQSRKSFSGSLLHSPDCSILEPSRLAQVYIFVGAIVSWSLHLVKETPPWNKLLYLANSHGSHQVWAWFHQSSSVQPPEHSHPTLPQINIRVWRRWCLHGASIYVVRVEVRWGWSTMWWGWRLWLGLHQWIHSWLIVDVELAQVHFLFPA